jgi:His-Xaa-Ser system radical SAM maturase HxsB
MLDDFRLLPIHFRRLENGKVVISNVANFYHILPRESDLKTLIDNPSKLEGELIKELEQKLFISKTEDFEAKLQLTTSGFSKRINKDLSSPRLIMIVPTLRCDHHCTYCQVSRVNQDVDGFDLPLSSIPALIRFIKQIESPPYKIEFQGGEPLLAFDFIIEFYEQMKQVASETDFSIVIATSLSLINEEILDWCVGKNINFSTSIDAGKKAHNKHRRLITKDSFQLVQRNISAIENRLGKGKIGTVTTVTHDGLVGYDELVDTHIALGLNEMFVRPVSSYGFAIPKQAKDISISEFMIFYRKLIFRLMDENLNGTPIIEHFLLIHYKRLCNAKDGMYVDLMAPAGYAKNSVLIDYTGNVFGSDEARMVFRKFDFEDLVIGHIHDELSPLDTEFSENILLDSFNFDIPGCSDCVYQGSCGSDPIYHLQEFGEPIGDKSNSRFCKLHKGVFDFVMELLTDKSYKKVLESWL